MPRSRSSACPPDVVVIDRGDVLRAKPEPDLFLACQERMGVRREDCYVVGDAVWDLLAARRAGMLSVGLLSGGYGEDELIEAGAFRVYRDAAGAARVARRAGGHAARLSADWGRRLGAMHRSSDPPAGFTGPASASGAMCIERMITTTIGPRAEFARQDRSLDAPT